MLAAELEAGRVLVHPLVIGELACGTLRNRREVLDLLGRLPSAPTATHAEALDFLHGQHVQHRDVKPDNVLLLQGYAKVADFGLARLQEGRLVNATACGISGISGKLSRDMPAIRARFLPALNPAKCDSCTLHATSPGGSKRT